MLDEFPPRDFHRALCSKLHVDIAFDPFIDLCNRLLSADENMASLVAGLASEHPLVLASNTDAAHFAHCRKNFDVLRPFGRFFLSYEMRRLHPDPAYFHHVLHGLHTPPADCIFIDHLLQTVP